MMPNMQHTDTKEMPMQAAGRRPAEPMDWTSEIAVPPAARRWEEPVPDTGAWGMPAANAGTGSTARRDGRSLAASMQMPPMELAHGQPADVIEMPVNLQEAYLGSLKAMLNRNKGNYIVATFLVGTQNTVSWEGLLYEVGNDFLTIYQPGRDRYIVADMYSLKYMEFYDAQKKELCDRLLRQQSGWMENR